jgi:hypothetical protein
MAATSGMGGGVNAGAFLGQLGGIKSRNLGCCEYSLLFKRAQMQPKPGAKSNYCHLQSQLYPQKLWITLWEQLG